MVNNGNRQSLKHILRVHPISQSFLARSPTGTLSLLLFSLLHFVISKNTTKTLQLFFWVCWIPGCNHTLKLWQLITNLIKTGVLCSELHFYGKQRRAERFAWLSGPGIYHGHLNLGNTPRLTSFKSTWKLHTIFFLCERFIVSCFHCT